MKFIITQANQYYVDSISLSTKKNTDITNEQCLERSPASLKAAIDLFKDLHPNIQFRSISNTYNCMGLIFASRRTTIPSFDQLKQILSDDEYEPVNEHRDVKIGDIVIYFDENTEPTHIGYVIRIDINIDLATFEFKILSKWGYDGEYLHDIDDIPESYGKDYKFYSESKIIK